jgi:hypothetical protein
MYVLLDARVDHSGVSRERMVSESAPTRRLAGSRDESCSQRTLA